MIKLTSRQLEALNTYADGLTLDQAAVAMKISVHTTKFHRECVLRRLNATNAAHAVAIAFRAGILR